MTFAAIWSEYKQEMAQAWAEYISELKQLWSTRHD